MNSQKPKLLIVFICISLLTINCIIQRERPGIIHLFYNEYSPDYKFYPQGNRIVYLTLNNKGDEILIINNLITNSSEEIFNIKNYDDIYLKKLYSIYNFYFFDNNLIILGGTSEENNRFIYYNYDMNLENNNYFQKIDVPVLLTWSIQSQTDRNLFVIDEPDCKKFTVYNYKDGTEKSYEYPILNDEIDNNSKVFCYGRNSDEIVFSVGDEKEHNIYIIFYDIKLNKINKKIVITNEFAKYYEISGFTNILLSPNARYIACVNLSSGIWLLDLLRQELLGLKIVSKEYRTISYLKMFDWSWDSSKFLFTRDWDLYLFDTKKFFEHLDRNEIDIFKVSIFDY